MPTIQYIVKRLFAGIEKIVMVNGRHKSSIEDHFDYAYELEDTLDRRGKKDLLAISKDIANAGVIISVRQKEP